MGRAQAVAILHEMEMEQQLVGKPVEQLAGQLAATTVLSGRCSQALRSRYTDSLVLSKSGGIEGIVSRSTTL